MFRRRRRESDAPVEGGPAEGVPGEDGTPVDGPDAVDAGEHRPAEPGRPQGPWDVDDVPDEVRAGQRLDLGGIDVPVLPGLELRIDMDQNQKPVAATVVSGQSAMQVNAFAAPRTEGIWAEVRAEILASLQAGGAREVEGPWGPEVHSKVPAGPPVPGRGTPVVDARFVGVDGPRWFLRGLISGPAATDPALAAPFEEVLRGVVVARGGEAMPPREPLPLVLPKQVQEAAAAQAEQQAQQQRAGQGQGPVAGQPPATGQAARSQGLGGQGAGATPAGQGAGAAPAGQNGGPVPAGQGQTGASAPGGPRVSMADQLAAAARAVAARQAGTGTVAGAPAATGPGPREAPAPPPAAAATQEAPPAGDPGPTSAPAGDPGPAAPPAGAAPREH